MLLALLLLGHPARGATIETLVMPGPVAESHTDIESNCDACHTKFDRQSQATLCLDCHEEVDADRIAGTGLHGRHPRVSAGTCSDCHAEHQGRDADILGLMPELFDHAFTDFELTGFHASAACAGCHLAGTLHRETPAACIDCHEQDDRHRSGLGAECGTCHAPSGWTPTTFDHGLATDFPLTGGHLNAPCAGCHANERYEHTPPGCAGCHAADDVHRGSRGDQCGSCHDTVEWTEVIFDHAATTGFPLAGAHETLVCSGCHLAGMALSELPTTCVGCHAASDPHLGRNGEACDSCHTQTDWQLAFDHEAASGFALTGAHRQASCDGCHKGALTDPVETDCQSCHRADDPHRAQLPACQDCHGDDSWTVGVRFDHDRTGFALLGAHGIAACEQCHDGLVFGDQSETDCRDCHGSDDIHRRSLGGDCGMCHSPVAWEFWTFDHDVQTSFELTGAHRGVVCSACHEPGNRKTPPSRCAGCHRQDDPHGGSFGPRCERCHTTDTFADPVMVRGR